MVFIKKNVLVLSLLHIVLLLAADRVAAYHIYFGRVRVQVNHDLLNSDSFTIHCKSRNDDLGTHVIAPDQNYNFDFKVNIWGTTLFFCGVGWQNRTVSFNVYDYERDKDRCEKFCLWAVTQSGMLGFPDSSSVIPDIAIPWA